MSRSMPRRLTGRRADHRDTARVEMTVQPISASTSNANRTSPLQCVRRQARHGDPPAGDAAAAKK